jgi:thioredoxin reductase (NADPH)
MIADDTLDCLIIGAGPAGLTAAIYLARYRLRIEVVDAGASRAALIPLTRNHAGFPGGISGSDLIALMRTQAAEFGALVTNTTVEQLRREGDVFIAESSRRRWRARAVLLATGVVNKRPPIDDDAHGVALARGLLRYCPICDGFEVTDRRVGVIGTATHGYNEALFLRTYTKDVTLISPDGPHALSEGERRDLVRVGVTLRDGPCHQLRIAEDEIVVGTTDGEQRFQSVYPALGSNIRSELAVAMGATASPDGCLVVDDHQRTSIACLYAAGDVVKGLDQISHAMGGGGVAATTIRNDLAKDRPSYR